MNTYKKITNTETYHLHKPLACVIEQVEDGYIIESKILGILGSGETIEQAERDFSQEFDYLYNKLENLEESQLSSRLRKAKEFFLLLLK